jgi:hypothetical protein
MSQCRDYARSLINNLSLLSKMVLMPTESQLRTICRHLQTLQIQGIILDDNNMYNLINGSETLNSDPDFKALKQLITKIKIKTEIKSNK